MIRCCVIACTNNSLKSDRETFFSIPSILEVSHLSRKCIELAEKRRRVWLERIHRTDLTRFHKVCSLHFVKGKPADLLEDTDADWCPSLHLSGKSSTTQTEVLQKKGSHVSRKKKKKRKISSCNILSEGRRHKVLKLSDTRTGDTKRSTVQTHPKVSIFSVQTDLTLDHIKELEKIEKDSSKITAELNVLKLKHIYSEIHEKSFEDKDDKVLFYTGFPSYALLMATFKFISSTMSFSHRNTLGQFQEFLLFLMRLRLNLPLIDLSYRFKVSLTTAYRIFDKWLEVCSLKLSCLIHWPRRQYLEDTMPTNFKDVVGNHMAIITDCFEVVIDRTGSLANRAIMWSQTKNHNTVKFIVGISPQGHILFVSDAWGGGTPDKYVIEQSGLLDKLAQGDLILSESGFRDSEDSGLTCAELGWQTCATGKSQLSEVEIDDKKKLENLRTSVERITGIVKKSYQILQGCLTIDYLKGTDTESQIPLERIAYVCCALTNLCRPVQPPVNQFSN